MRRVLALSVVAPILACSGFGLGTAIDESQVAVARGGAVHRAVRVAHPAWPPIRRSLGLDGA